MKTLFIGFLAFIAWASLSTYIYVCKIQGLCGEPEIIELRAATQEDVIAEEPIPVPLVQENVIIPKDLVIYFAFDKSEFQPDSITGNYISESKVYLDQNSKARLCFTGHTDAVGSDAYNLALGYRRAQSVLHYFESKGMTAMNSIVESMGEKEPVDDNNTPAGRANNRRTVVTITK
jgi:outer membrane protein OmpA-like peptidoglycan-associated protein